MALIFDHQPIDREPGSYTFPAGSPGNVPDGFTRVRLALARQTTATPSFWAEGVDVAVTIQDSLDGGNTWLDLCGFTAGGGILPGKNGGEATESRCSANFHPGTSRLARILYSITGGNLVSELTLEAI